MKILITAFEPFGKDSLNASGEAVSHLPDTIAGAEIIKRELPVVYNEAGRILISHIESIQPDLVICVGQAGGTDAVRIEKVGLNWRAGKIADNEGVIYSGEKILNEGDTAYFSTLPVETIADAIGAADIAAQVSYSAGTYVCNTVLYTLLHYLSQNQSGIRGGFIHVPCIEAQTETDPKRAAMPLDSLVRALEIAVKVCVEEKI